MSGYILYTHINIAGLRNVSNNKLYTMTSQNYQGFQQIAGKVALYYLPLESFGFE